MSLLDTIEIQGVRSVGIGPSNAAVIEFLTPLTIICGPNGCGKTTIIESLKYATTGEFPPGKMATFIHDYRLASKARVDALVKLKFRDVRGRTCIITRRMSARDSGKGKVTAKSEEATICIENDGETQSLSSKSADTKREVLLLLGVPAAILEYVVFCHQEESTWPLDEPKKLKERFDEIFQVTGYVKAIDTLKKIMKENIQDARVIEATLPHLIKQQEDKVKLHNDYILLKQLSEAKGKEISALKLELKELDEKAKDTMEELGMAEKAGKESDILEHERKILKDQYRKNDAPDYQGTIEDLQAEIKAIAESAEFMDIEADRERVEDMIKEFSNNLEKAKEERERLHKRIASMKADEIVRGKCLKERNELWSQIRNDFEIVANDEDVEQRLNEFEKEHKTNFLLFQTKQKETESTCRRELAELNSQYTQVKTGLSFTDAECTKLKGAISDLQKGLSSLADASHELESLEKQIKISEENLRKIPLEEDFRKKMDELKVEKENVISKISGLRKEKSESEEAERAEKAVKEKENAANKVAAELEQRRAKHQRAFTEIFGEDDVQYPVRSALEKKTRRVNAAVQKVDEKLEKIEKEKTERSDDVVRLKTQIEQKNDQITTYTSNIEKVVHSGESVKARLDEESAILNKLRKNMSEADGFRFVYEKYEGELLKKSCCPLCENKLRTEKDVKELIEKIKKRNADLPSEIAKLRKEIKIHEEKQMDLTAVLPFEDILRTLKREKGDAEADLKEAKGALSAMAKETDKAQGDKRLLLEKKGMIDEVMMDASYMDGKYDSLKEIQREVNRMKSDLDEDCARRSSDEVNNQISDLESHLKKLDLSIESEHASISHRSKKVSELNDLREKRTNVGKMWAQKDSIEKALEEKRNDLEERSESIREYRLHKPQLEAKIREKEAELQKMQKVGSGEEERYKKLETAVKFSKKSLESVNKRLAEAADNSLAMRECKTRVGELTSQIETTKERISALNGERDVVTNKQERKRRMDEQLRKMELKQGIAKCEKRLRDVHWKGEPLEALKLNVRDLNQRRETLRRDIDTKTGEVAVQKTNIAGMKKKLDSKEFVNSEEECKRAVIRKCVTEKVAQDLDTYVRVVDECVVKFHTQKMEEINAVLRELWEKVYRGDDIESIQIKSENVDEGEKRRSYNYRVVMSIDGNEIDMPGRCSAGQKMLASILIRIALSDVFCDRCSIIALDEPTTNLDVLKVENLGDMLSEVVKERSGLSRKKFQLIVITHDDRFVEHLRQLCQPDWVYALVKDSTGLSRVKRHRHVEDAATRTS